MGAPHSYPVTLTLCGARTSKLRSSQKKGFKEMLFTINGRNKSWLAACSCDDVEIVTELEKESCALATDPSACIEGFFFLL